MALVLPNPPAHRWATWLRRLDSVAPAVVTLALATGALLLGWRGVDQAAQTYRVEQFRTHGLMLWDNGWYGGNFPLGYSVLFPPVAALVGLQVLAVTSAVVATWAFDRVVRSYLGARPLGTWYFAVSALLPVTIGQWPFLAGEAAGLGALVALQRGRRTSTLGLAVVSALFSPLAAAFLAMVCLAWALDGSVSRRWVIATAAASLVVVLGLGVAFPGTGPFPFPWGGMVLTELLCLMALSPFVSTTPVVRIGAALYGGATLFSFMVANPLGGNAPRLAESIGVPLLACFVAAPGPAWARLRQVAVPPWLGWRRLLVPHGRVGRLAPALLLLPFAVWQWSPWRLVDTTPASTPWTASGYYSPLIAAVDRLAHHPVRLEIPPTLDHWEAAFVAPHISLARGWERQLDVVDNPLFYGAGALTAAAYGRWLAAEGVSYVALPSAPLDYAATGEGALLKSGAVAVLAPVWSNHDWQLWAVGGSPGLISGPGLLTSLEPDHLTIDATGPGTITVRVRYTGFWAVESGPGCVVPVDSGPGTSDPAAPPYQWTQIQTAQAGRIVVSAAVVHSGEGAVCRSS